MVKLKGGNVMFILQKREASKIVAFDSAVAYNGSFKMKGPVKYPDMVLQRKGTRMRAQFYLENAEINVGKLVHFGATIAGSKTQDEYNAFVNRSTASMRRS
jgi:hypothetical protein